MPYNNNDWGNETDAQHSERAHTLANGIGTYGTILNFTAGEITTLEGYADLFDTALSLQVEETADYQAKSVGQKDAEEEVHKQYLSCQDYIRGEMVFASDPDKEYLNERFDIYGEMPTSREGLVKVARTMLTGFDSIDVELPSVTLPDSLFESLRTKLNSLTAISEDDIKDELSQQKAATTAKNILRVMTGERLFRRVYHRAVAFWGDDDPRLLEIGMLPKSQIWTPGQPVPGGANWPDKPENMSAKKGTTPPFDTDIIIKCDLLNGAATYNIYREKKPTGEPRPSRPAVTWMSGVDEPSFMDGETAVGFTYYYWICGVNADGVEGAFSDAMMEWVG